LKKRASNNTDAVIEKTKAEGELSQEGGGKLLEEQSEIGQASWRKVTGGGKRPTNPIVGEIVGLQHRSIQIW